MPYVAGVSTGSSLSDDRNTSGVNVEIAVGMQECSDMIGIRVGGVNSVGSARSEGRIARG